MAPGRTPYDFQGPRPEADLHREDGELPPGQLLTVCGAGLSLRSPKTLTFPSDHRLHRPTVAANTGFGFTSSSVPIPGH